MKIDSKQIKLPHCEIHYLEAGPADRPTVILLHGLKFQASTWDKLGTLEAIASAGFRAIALDMPGFGASPASEVTPESVLLDFFQQLQISSPILIGPSMGGRISLEFALDHPGLLGALVLVGSVGVRDQQQRLSQLNLPLLIVWGSEDQIAPVDDAQLLHKTVTGSRKVIIDAAPHPCYLEEPEKWHDTLIEFLATL